MIPPMISFSTFNRMGLTVRNMDALLQTTDDFELYIVDSNSKDNTWDYIQSLNDSRIKSKVRLPQNKGPIYATNFNLAKRKAEQYFITLDSDVYIYTKDWISRFMKVFNEFPEVGLLGVSRARPYPEYIPEVINIERNGVGYRQLKNGKVGVALDFVPGHCQCLRPELIDIIGYWSEESHYGDAELSIRVKQYTNYQAGFVNDIEIDMEQFVPCRECQGQSWCKLARLNHTCFGIRLEKYKNESFATTFEWKQREFFKELEEGKRQVYCASIHDEESRKNHLYNESWARENFDYYIKYAN